MLAETRHPFGIVTKGSLVERDLDLLAPLAQQELTAVYVSVTTLDAELSRKLEPRCASPARRLRTIATLARAGVPVCVNVAPIIPFITEPDLEAILQAAADAGARGAFYTVLRLPWEVSPLFREWLAAHYPQRAERVMHRVQDMRRGRDYNAEFRTRMKGEGAWADLIRQRFDVACRRLDLVHERFRLRNDLFRPPSVPASRASAPTARPRSARDVLTPAAARQRVPAVVSKIVCSSSAIAVMSTVAPTIREPMATRTASQPL